MRVTTKALAAGLVVAVLGVLALAMNSTVSLPEGAGINEVTASAPSAKK